MPKRFLNRYEGANEFIVYHLCVTPTEFKPESFLQATEIIAEKKENGWGTRIRTLISGVRVRRLAIRPSPNDCRKKRRDYRVPERNCQAESRKSQDRISPA